MSCDELHCIFQCFLSVCLSVSVCLAVCLSACLSACLPVCLSVCLQPIGYDCGLLSRDHGHDRLSHFFPVPRALGNRLIQSVDSQSTRVLHMLPHVGTPIATDRTTLSVRSHSDRRYNQRSFWNAAPNRVHPNRPIAQRSPIESSPFLIFSLISVLKEPPDRTIRRSPDRSGPIGKYDRANPSALIHSDRVRRSKNTDHRSRSAGTIGPIGRSS